MNIIFNYRRDREYQYETLISRKLVYLEIYMWCRDTFGHPGIDPKTGIYSGWHGAGGWIMLRGSEEFILFKLRWACTI